MKAVEYFEKKLRLKSRSTQHQYQYYLGLFLDYAGFSHERLYEIHCEALGAGDPRDSDFVVELAEDFLNKLEADGYSNSHCNMVLKALNFFFDANKLEFDSSDVRRRAIYQGKRRARKGEILEMYRYCQRDMKQRNRALVMVAKDCGLRESDMALMNVEDYLEARDVWWRGERFKVFEPVKTVKTRDIAHPHLGPESIVEVERLIGYQRRGPLFLDRGGKRMKAKAMASQFIRLSSTLGATESEVSGHSLRKFFSTMLEEVMPESWVKLLMGKSVGPYSVPLEKLTESYMKNYDQLRIFSVGVDREEFDVMKKELEALRSMVVTGLDRYKRREEFEGE